MSDKGKYKCIAQNQYTKKLVRNVFFSLIVMSRNDNDNDDHGRNNLLPQLQKSIQKIKSGHTLMLHCASKGGKVSRAKS
jgi:hypothetical protein